MAIGILRIGIFIFVFGFLSFFWTRSDALASLISSVGFLLFVVGFSVWSLEASGDISLS